MFIVGDISSLVTARLQISREGMGMERTIEVLCSNDRRVERDCLRVLVVDVYRTGAGGCNVSLISRRQERDAGWGSWSCG